MYFKQFYLGCLAQASYLIGSRGEAAVVDPRRDVEEYLEEAKREGLAVRHILETHLHADFVSGHRELAERTGAKVYISGKAGAKFAHVPVTEGAEISFGDVTLRFLETPGHTPESVCILVFDRSKSADEPQAVLTGDTLFIGDVGRPDLHGATITPQEAAGTLYDSLHGKLMRLPDSVAVYPAHGAGSLCGKNISSETSSTIGQQRLSNLALQPMSREQFTEMTSDLPEAPAYFASDVAINRAGATRLDELPEPRALSPEIASARQKSGAILLDTRPAALYGSAHVPGSIHIGLSGQFASWAGTLFPLASEVILIAEDSERIREARMRLARVGIENVPGYLAGGVEAWGAAGLPVTSTEQISVAELDRRLRERAVDAVLDVRRPGEWHAGHIPSATHHTLSTLPGSAPPLDPSRPLAVICGGGYRSSIATSLLEQKGFTRLVNVTGGMGAWNGASLPVVAAA